MTRASMLAALLVTSIISAVPGAGSAVAAESCIESVPGLVRETSGGFAPVLFVHGWTGSAGDWQEPIDKAINESTETPGRSLVEQVGRIEGADTWLLDYHETSARWIDDPEGGGTRVAAAIDCLHSVYGVWVSVIAHSMGGLATKWAAGVDDRHTKLASVVTFGTPHEGSDVAGVFAALLRVGDERSPVDFATPGHIAVLRACGLLTNLDSDSCAPLPAFLAAFDSDAGVALRAGSRQLTELPAWPEGLPVLAIAGEIEIVLQSGSGLFYQDHASFRVGDGIVSRPSATSAGTEIEVGGCRHNFKSGYAISDDVRQLLGVHNDEDDERSIIGLINTPCWHGRLMQGIELTNDALGFVATNLPDEPTPSSPSLVDYPIDWMNTIVLASTTNQPELLAYVTRHEGVLQDLRQVASQPLEVVGTCEFNPLQSVCYLRQADGTTWEVFYVVGSDGEGIGSINQVEGANDDPSPTTTSTTTAAPPANSQELAEQLIEAANNNDRAAANALAPNVSAADLDRLFANAPYTFDGCSTGSTTECYAYNNQMEVIIGIETTIVYVGFNAG